MHWGLENFGELDVPRPQYKGKLVDSEVDGTSKVLKDRYGKLKRLLTQTITFAFISWVVFSVCLLYGFEKEWEEQKLEQRAKFVKVLVAIQMITYTQVWRIVAVKLTDFDNWRTENEYYEALVYRVFSFSFINSFFPLFYTALILHMGSDCGAKGTCTSELGAQLRVLFLMSMFFELLNGLQPYLAYRFELWREGSSASSEHGHASGEHDYKEAQQKLGSPTVDEEIWMRVDNLMELGYVLFFGFSAPEILLLFLFTNLLRMKALGWMLINALRRPFPRRSPGIGAAFFSLYIVICRVAVVSNIVLLLVYNAQGASADDLFRQFKLLVANPLPAPSAAEMAAATTKCAQLAESSMHSMTTCANQRSLDWKSILAAAMLLDRVVVGILWCIDVFIPDVPKDVSLLIQRREVIVANLRKSTKENPNPAAAEKELRRVITSLPSSYRGICVTDNDNGTGTYRWSPIELEELAKPGAVPPLCSDDPWFQKAFQAKTTQEATGGDGMPLKPMRRVTDEPWKVAVSTPRFNELDRRQLQDGSYESLKPT